MSPRPAAFAIPGDITTLTGGYIYERRLLEALRAQGRDVQHIALGDSFPNPTPADMTHAVAALSDVEPGRALILDGLVFGAIDTAGLARVRAPIVAMIHHPLALETGLDQASRDHLFKTERDNLHLAAHVLVPSAHTAEILRTQYDVPGQRITIAQPGSEARGGISVASDPPLVLAVGILHPRKGHDTLLRALAFIRDHAWRAVIVGRAHDPAHAKELEQLIASLDLGARVLLPGRIPRADLDRLYAQARLFALATRYEGYGMVFDEALVWGLPIVSCATGAVPQTVPSGAGLLVAPDTPAALAEALERVLSDDALRDRMAAVAARAGAGLPGWQDTARVAGSVLDQLSAADRGGVAPGTVATIRRSLDVYYRDTARTARMDRLNAQFISKGSLAFDLGAHVGDRTDSFLRLGAEVVALEPQPAVFRALRLIHGRKPAVHLRCEAVGARQDEIDLYLNSRNPTVATASSTFVAAAPTAVGWKDQIWDRKIRVPVTTLDLLIAEFGMPDFVKIDVEGHELQVLEGLSRPLSAVSFEFTTHQRDAACACIRRLCALGRYAFNLSLGEDHALRHEIWVPPTQIAREVMELPEAANSGDIYARVV